MTTNEDESTQPFLKTVLVHLVLRQMKAHHHVPGFIYVWAVTLLQLIFKCIQHDRTTKMEINTASA